MKCAYCLEDIPENRYVMWKDKKLPQGSHYCSYWCTNRARALRCGKRYKNDRPKDRYLKEIDKNYLERQKNGDILSEEDSKVEKQS